MSRPPDDVMMVRFVPDEDMNDNNAVAAAAFAHPAVEPRERADRERVGRVERVDLRRRRRGARGGGAASSARARGSAASQERGRVERGVERGVVLDVGVTLSSTCARS